MDASLASINCGTNEIDDLIRINENLKTNHLELEALLNEAYDQQDEVVRIKKEFKECEIPVNIGHRKNEIDAYALVLD